MNIAVATPKGYECGQKFIDEAVEIAKKSGSVITITNDAIEAVRMLMVYTDT